MHLLLVAVHHVHHSSTQGEPEWLLLHSSEKLKQFDTLKSWTEWTGLKVLEAGFHNMLRTAVTCRVPAVLTVTMAKMTAAVSRHFTPEAGCVTSANKPRILNSGLGRKK